jgi:soluble lytic murein transglycosylase-like protein
MRIAGAGYALLVLLTAVGCKPAEETARTAVPISPQQVVTLFAKVGVEGTPSVDAEMAMAGKASRNDPNWPALIYLIGEAHLQRRDVEQARAAFRDLATWAAAGRTLPSQDQGAAGDGWGGSGLAAVALWRWLQILDEQGGEPQEVDRVLRVAASLQGMRLFTGMVHGGLLPALPLLEEDVARRLAHIAGKAGRSEAMALFLDFVSIDSTGERTAADEEIVKRMIDEGLATRERLDLFRYRRQLSLVKTEARKQQAADRLRQLWENEAEPADVRAEAGYEWGNFYRQSKEKKPAVIAALSSAYELSGGTGLIAEKALFQRAMVQSSVSPRRSDLFFADMQRLLERHPNSRLADDALYQVAAEQLFIPPAQPDRAFATFEKLRAFPGPNDWQDSAYFLAAMGQLDRGTDADVKAADRLLAAYVERYPDGVFRQRCLFWRGRIAERTQDAAAARRLFQQVVAEAPFDYHGLRARLHLEVGANASRMGLPGPASQTFEQLRAAYQRSSADVELAGATPYHDRLRAAEANRLYAQVLAIVDGLGRRFRNRLDNIALDELDQSRLVPAAALLLALRQDALAARDAQLTTDNQLRLSGFLGRKVGDWPTAMTVIAVPGDAPRRRLTDLQTDPRYLATAYPSAPALAALRAPLADAAWPIDGSTALAQSLMYAVVRRESAYYPGAISAVGALGLFQIMPLTFENRKDCWKVREPDERPTPTSYLFDPNRNTQFWSCWVRKEFEPKTRDDIALMLVRHHAGSGSLEEWRKAWKGRTIENDLEMQIETLRFPATQLFVRHVLIDIAIADAAGLFGSGATGSEEKR